MPEIRPLLRRAIMICLCVLIAVLAGCGGNGPGRASVPPPPITGPYSNATITGPYAFVFSGKDTAGFFGVAGNFQANGAGALTSGLMDINSGTGVSTSVPFTGTYSILANGQGTATLNSTVRNFSLRFIVIAPAHARIVSFDNSAGGNGDLIAFLPTPAFNLGGTFGFNLAGIDAGASPLLTLGAFTGDGLGNVTSGVQDISDNGTISAKQAVTGTYTLPVNGRGTLTLTTALGALHFAYYVSTPFNLMMVETERGPALAGETFPAQAVPNITLPGCLGCVYALSGLSSGQPLAEAGIFQMGTAGTVSGLAGDVNLAGATNHVQPSSGVIAFDPAFRGTMNLGARNFAIYPSSQGVFMMQTDAGQMIAGVAINQGQIGTPDLDLSFNGNYAFYSSGMALVMTTNEVGQVTASNPPSGTVSGHLDMIANGVPAPGLPFTGTFLTDKFARGTVTLQTSTGNQHMVIYTTGGAGPMMFVGTDSNFVVSGGFEMQQ